VRNGHFALGDFGFGGADEAQLAAAERVAVSHARGRPEYPAGHGPPGVNIAQAGRGIERGASSLAGEVVEASLVRFGRAKEAGDGIAGEVGQVLSEPDVRAALEVGGKGGLFGAQSLHAGAEAEDIEGIDGKGSVATLGAAGAASEPRAGALRCFSQRRIHDLHQLGIGCGKAHAAKDTRRSSQRAALRPTYHRVREVIVLFLERIPGAPLAGFVRMLWYARVSKTGPGRERVLPNGCVQVILNLARDFLLDCPEGENDLKMPHSLIVGARSVYEIVDTSDMADLIGVIFEPGGFGPFAGDAVDLFSNRSTSLEDVWSASARSLRDRLREIEAPQARLRCMEDFLTERFGARLAQVRSSRHGAVEFALSRFRRAPGVSTVREVARCTGWSERRFSQVFRESVGLSPKVWCRIERFQRAVRMLHSGADMPWAELALNCGFYDQSHFANEFRAFSGVDASTYSALRSRWTNHIQAQ